VLRTCARVLRGLLALTQFVIIADTKVVSCFVLHPSPQSFQSIRPHPIISHSLSFTISYMGAHLSSFAFIVIFPSLTILHPSRCVHSPLFSSALLFRAAPSSATQPCHLHPAPPTLTLYDNLFSQTLATPERLLLHSLSHKPAPVVRQKSIDTIRNI
jgi:hypothetical protein